MSPKWQFGLLLLLIALVNVAAGYLTSDESSPSGWALVPLLLTIVLLIQCFAVIGRLPPLNDWRGVLIDQRNKISLSRLQLVVWSILVISAAITYGTLNAMWGQPHALDLSIPKELWILLGISTGSFVAAPLVLGTKDDALDVNPENEHPWRDIFYGDDKGNSDRVDFSKVQQFFFTIVLVIVYAVSVGAVLLRATSIPGNGPGPVLIFPPLDAGFIGIMAVSQTAYIAYKAMPQSKTDA
ncbi:MAG TPA: hypothetical protein VEJ16_15955 [Alphaproteobacteria bacterium]|nr:hypothetical protein [Alphaproteobacteria bacterium]